MTVVLGELTGVRGVCVPCVITVNQNVSFVIWLVNKREKREEVSCFVQIKYHLLHVFKKTPYKIQMCLVEIIHMYLILQNISVVYFTIYKKNVKKKKMA